MDECFVKDKQLCRWRQPVGVHAAAGIRLHTESDDACPWCDAVILPAALCHLWQGMFYLSGCIHILTRVWVKVFICGL